MSKNYNLGVLAAFFVLLVFQLHSQTKAIPYQQLSGTSGMFFGASMTTSSITVTFAGPSTKWIGLGFGTSMSGADALIYSNGQSSSPHALGWNDYHLSSTSPSGITNDAVQNWNIISNNVSAGQRTVVATRALNTGDPSDVVFNFSSAAISLIWARGATNDYTLAYHGSSNRAFGISLSWLTQPTASFSIVNQTVCVGSSVTYNNLTTGSPATFTWSLPGTIAGTSTSTNPVVTYTAPGVYSVALTASNVAGTSTLSQVAYITVNPNVVPTVSITQTSGSNPICQGQAATFSVSYTNGGTSPQFQWLVNNQNVGTNSTSFSSTTIANASNIVCVLTSPSVCASNTVNTSAAIVLTVNSNAPATVTVNLNSGSNPMCIGAQTSFSAAPGNGGNAPSYQWLLNGSAVGSGNSTFTPNALNNGDVITCSIVSSASCAITTTAVSSAVIATVSAVLVPSVAILSSATNNSACAGSVITFSASPFAGGLSPIYQWQINGNTVGGSGSTFTLSLSSSTNAITCTLTSNSPCSSPNTATSTVFQLLVNPTPPAPVISPAGTLNLCSGSSLTLSSSAPNGNTWSGGANSNTLLVNSVGVYTVTQTQLGCTSASSASVYVVSIPSPTAQLTTLQPLCKDDGSVVLQGTPAGGSFSGSGVQGTSFNPNISGTGTFVLVYQFVDGNSCSDTAAIVANVAECLGSLNERLIQNNVNIYPNPSGGVLTIESPDYLIVNVVLHDISGKEVYKSAGINSNTFQLREIGISSGLYDLELFFDKAVVHKRVQIVK